MTRTPDRPGSWISVALLVLLGLAAWLPAVHPNIESYDSLWLVRDNPILNQGDLSQIPRILFDFSKGTRRVLGSEFLPIRDLTVLLDFRLAGTAWAWHHLQNVIWYLGACVLFLRIAQSLLGRGPLALVAAAAFLLHPIHVESVVWLASRKDVVSLFFVFLAVRVWLADEKRGRAFAICLVSYALACGSKNTAVVLPGLLFVLSTWIRREDWRRWRFWLPWPGFAVVTLTCVSIGTKVGSLVGMYADRRGGSLAASLLLEGQVILRYLGLMAWPWHLSPLYPEPIPQPLMHPSSMAGLGGVALLVGAAVACRHRARLVPLGIAWFFLALLPVSQIVPIQNLMADRYLLLPSAGLILALAGGVRLLPERIHTGRSRWTALGAATVLLVVLALATSRYCRIWQTDVSLWTWAHDSAPVDPRITINLAGSLVEADRTPEAVAILQDALIRNQDGGLYQTLGWVLLTQGRVAEAEAALRQALVLEPDRAKASANLVNLLLGQARVDEALVVAERLVRLRPMYSEGWNAYGAALLEARRLDEARVALDRSLMQSPYDATTMCNRGSVEYLAGDQEAAGRWWRQCLQLDPGNTYAARALQALQGNP